MRKKILVAPLDWGLGHATRCIPIIKELNKRHEVLIATSGLALPLLKEEFPGFTFFQLPSYRASYSRWLPLLLKVFLQAPKFFFVIRREHQQLEELVSKHHIDVVISDNRYGCFSKKVKSIFITHQVNILMPSGLKWLQPAVNYVNHKFIKRFTECWIPDFEVNRITEKLTTSKNLDVKFLGMLSRFQKSQQPIIKKYDLLILLSGPEPQRSAFEEILIEQIKDFKGSVLLVRGLPGEGGSDLKLKHIDIENHFQAHQLQHAIEASDLVLSRSGYTTIMDLYFLRKKAIFVPTPGQTEQEYLANQLMKRKIAYSMPQYRFQLQKALKEASAYTGFIEPPISNFELIISNL